MRRYGKPTTDLEKRLKARSKVSGVLTKLVNLVSDEEVNKKELIAELEQFIESLKAEKFGEDDDKQKEEDDENGWL